MDTTTAALARYVTSLRYETLPPSAVHDAKRSEPAKWDPRTRETADHSLPYMLAVALRDGHVTPASFEPARNTWIPSCGRS